MTFEEVFSYEHLFDCAKECCNGVRWKESTQNFELNIAMWVSRLYEQLHNGTYKSKGFTNFYIHERGKLRYIQAVHISERCVQKCLCKYCLKPMLIPKLIYDNSASIKGKGTHFALKRLKKHLSYHFKKHGRKGGILLIDYKSYFPSIMHETLKEMLRKEIQDDRIYRLCAMFIDCFDGDCGLGLGSEMSQICAIYYTNEIDHYIKEQLHIKGYGRYMDDSYLIHEDIEYLKYCKETISKMSEKYGLRLNTKRTRIVRLTDTFSYLKKRIFITESGRIVMRLTRDNIKRRRRVIRATKEKGEDYRANNKSWRGSVRKFDAYKTIISIENYMNRLEAQDD